MGFATTIPSVSGTERSWAKGALVLAASGCLLASAPASAQCQDDAPTVLHGSLPLSPEPESLVLLRHVLPRSNDPDVRRKPDRAALIASLDRVLARIRTAWPDMAVVTARPLWQPGRLILHSDPSLGGRILRGLGKRGTLAPFCTGHAGFDALSRVVGLRAVATFSHLPDMFVMDFDSDLDVPSVAARYESLDGMITASPDAPTGDSPGIQVSRLNGEWFLVFREAWGDCPSGCMYSEFHFFVADERRVARIHHEKAVRMEGFSDILTARGWRLQ